MDEGDLAAAVKRIPAVAANRSSLAQTIRTIRRMNPRVARHALDNIRRERQQVVHAWFGADEREVLSFEATLEFVLRALLEQLNDPNEEQVEILQLETLLRVSG